MSSVFSYRPSEKPPKTGKNPLTFYRKYTIVLG